MASRPRLRSAGLLTVALAAMLGLAGGVVGGERFGSYRDALPAEAGQPPAWRGPSFDPRRYADAAVEGVVRKACASPAPFVVLDSFSFGRPANLDDDLGEPSDSADANISHGDVVAAIAALGHGAVTTYQIDPVFNAFTLARDFAALARDVASGKVARPAAVVTSIVLPVHLDDVNRALPADKAVSAADLRARRGEVMAALIADGDPRNPYRIVGDALAALARLDVPVFAASGNTGPDGLVNVLALNDGVYAVGALDGAGRPTVYTSTPEMTAIWAPGQFVLRETTGGLSLTGGRDVAFAGATAPGRKGLIASIVGRDPATLVRSVPASLAGPDPSGPGRRQRTLRRYLEPGLYRTADLLAAYGYDMSSGNVARSLEQGPYMHYPSDAIFRLDKTGRLAFDPLGDGSPGQLVAYDATSFATPNVCPSPQRVAQTSSPR
ncbi:S8/S53 family peptidase [Methylopila sp. Yamaguchi]|uniref:S8/S53 family peptidase n=1 Tax=Methylopila sp. Yamaguchi TaxID=1437817 RepID=UPI000CCBE7C4|nr:S8/S53 family peptidase [Methylopila sp. Yamaguchi]